MSDHPLIFHESLLFLGRFDFLEEVQDEVEEEEKEEEKKKKIKPSKQEDDDDDEDDESKEEELQFSYMDGM